MAESDGKTAHAVRTGLTGLCWAIFGCGGLLLSLTVLPAARHLAPSEREGILKARRVLSASFRLYFRVLRAFGIADIDASALRPLRTQKSAVIAANHPTLLDYVVVTSALPEACCLVKADLLRNFFLRRVIREADYLANSEDPEALLEECGKRLASGECLLIFPEGTRTKPGQQMRLKRGAAQIALRAGAPIAAVRIKCTETWLVKGAPWYSLPSRKPRITASPAGTIRTNETKNSDASLHAEASRITSDLARLLGLGNEP